jgi:CheY-like chemotaxis protein
MILALVATGCSPSEAMKELEGQVDPSDLVRGMVAAFPDQRSSVVRLLASMVWQSDAPKASLPGLRDAGIQPVELAVAAQDLLGETRACALLGALDEDMDMVRDFATHGVEGLFRLPMGRSVRELDASRFGIPDLTPDQDGRLCCPRNVVAAACRILDPKGMLVDLSVSLDSLRAAPQVAGVTFNLSHLAALKKLPDTIALGRQDKLILKGCVSLQSLPAHLTLGVEATLDLDGCIAWDGLMPATAKIGRDAIVRLPDGATVPAASLVPGKPMKQNLVTMGAVRSAVRVLELGGTPFPKALREVAERGAPDRILADLFQERMDKASGRRVNGFMKRNGDALHAFLSLALTADAELTNRLIRLAKPLEASRDKVVFDRTIELGRPDSLRCPSGVRTALTDFPAIRNAEWIRCDQLQALARIPEGLEVRRLDIEACPNFRSLPQSLRCGLLLIRDCPQWDGVIPDGVDVLQLVATDAHPDGVALSAWRLAHPHGEKTP